MRIRINKFIPEIFLMFFVNIFAIVLIKFVALKNIPNGTLKGLLLVFISVVMFCLSIYFIFAVEKKFYDDFGIHVFKIWGNEVTCSWQEITMVQYKRLGFKNGKYTLVYSDKKFVCPNSVKPSLHSAEAFLLPCPERKFLELLERHRPDIVIQRID